MTDVENFTRLVCGEHGAPLRLKAHGRGLGITCEFTGPVGHPLTDPEPCDLDGTDLQPEPGERITTSRDGGLYLVGVDY